MGYMQFNGYGNQAGISFGTGTTTSAPGNVTERMRINSSGNVGIGTTSPGGKLDVDGTVLATSFAGRAYPYNSILGSGADASTGTIFAGSTSGQVSSIDVAGGGATNPNPNTIILKTTSAERMRITSAGDVVVGTTAALLNTSGRGNITINGSSESIMVLSNGGAWKSYLFNNGTNTILGATGDFSIATNSGGTTVLHANTSGNVGIGTTSPAYKLDVSGSANITGTLTATVKSFIIDHPTKQGKKLQYGVLEGPEHSVYVRGKLTNNNTITLPDHWTGLVHEDTITVNLTPIGRKQDLWVETVTDTAITVGSNNKINCFYTVFAERKDIEKLVIEFDKE